MFRHFLVIAMLILAGCASTPACVPNEHRLCPIDEGGRDASFARFRQELRAAVQQRDAARLLTMVDPHIRTSFGDDGGIQTFEQSPPWDDLAKVLDLGGAFRGDSFWAPYVYASWPEAVDPFAHVAAIRANVPIREKPEAQSRIVEAVDWEILEVTGERTRDWVRVKQGWVRSADVHSPVGYRAGFSKRTGSWKLEAFVAGD